ncbi:MAG: hypothetical protein H6Q05_2251 [Acidobacteria bacterium]|nr:hypothetical protein [Acidobacteriota bacterium]
MKAKWLLAAGIPLFLPLAGNVWPQSEFFRVEDLRPGMKGIGKTCFQGSKPEEFQVEILGVMRRVTPGSDAVLARLSGGQLAQVGVFEGMSGSPVFIEGKLLGAVAFSFPFAKEAIAGITPITQMVDAFAEGMDLDGSGTRIIIKKSMLWNYQLPQPEVPAWMPGQEVSPLDARLQPALGPLTGHALQPIATPLSIGGARAETLRRFEPQFRALGFSVLQGSGATMLQAAGATRKAAAGADSSPLEPGSNLVIPLVQGDLDFSAGGTVTYISGNKLYAFGHPLFNLGFSELPMYKGRAVAVFPSLQSSFKILEATDPVGVLRQDRGLGVYGILGEKARMIPMRITMNTSRGMRKVLNYQLVQDRFLTALLINLTVFETINATERAMGVTTVRMKGKISVKGQEAIELESRFSSDSSSSANAALSIAVPVNFILASGYRSLELENIDLEVTSLEDDRSALLDSLRMDRSELRPGETLLLDVYSKKANGEVMRDSYPVRIPPDLPAGPVLLLVADGSAVMSMDAQEQGEDLIPRDLSQLIRFINNLRKNDRLYLRMFRREAGAIVHGEGLPGLPPSILSILKSDRSSGSMTLIQTLPLMEYELPPSNYVVSGSKLLNLVIKP